MMLAPIARAALVLTLLFSAVALPACAPVSPPFNPVAQSNAASLKVETLALLDTAGDPYDSHAAQIDALSARIDAAASLASANPANSLAARQWAVLRDPARSLYGGTLQLWRTQGTLGPAFREQKKIQIGRAFDYILCLEANKLRAQSCGDVQQGAAP